MEERSALALPKERTQEYEEAMRRNLAALMRSGKMSQTQLKDELEKRGLSVQQGNLSLYLSGKKSIPLSVIVQLCDIFQVSLAELVSEDFGGARQADPRMPRLYSGDLLNLVPSLGDAFITDPASPEFRGYLQTYYVYQKPTLSFVKKLQAGTLTLEASGSVCEATLKLHCDEKVDGENVCKIYRGRAVISTQVDAVYVLLSSPIEGELSVISFRHSHRPHQPLNCRLAAVLTNEAGDFHSPTVSRMFLSRIPIAEEHQPLLVPHLYLNGRDITVKAEQLERLRQEHAEYGPLIDRLEQFQPLPTYYWTEEYVMGTGRFLLDGNGLYTFLTQLRGISEAPYQNKVSHTADHRIRNLLLMLGYYSE